MRKQLPTHPSLGSLKNQAKQLHHALEAGDTDACERVSASFPRLTSSTPDAVRVAGLSLRDVQLVIAREYGFASWPAMVASLGGDEGDGGANDRLENPFITGNPVRTPQMFYGRGVDLAFLRDRIAAASPAGAVVLLTGPRRAGKTSFLFSIVDGRLGGEVMPVFLDMQQHAFSRVRATQSPRDSLLPKLDEVHAQVAAAPRRLLLLVDEAEILRDLVTDGGVEGAVLRRLAVAVGDGLSLVLAGPTRLGDGDDPAWRDLLRGAHWRELSPLSAEDARRLLQEPLPDSLTWEDGVVEAACKVTGGQPYYTQLVGANLVDQLNARGEHTVGVALLEAVVETIVANPPIQLVYAFDSLKGGEPAWRLLRLLATHGAASAETVARLSGERGEPLEVENVEATMRDAVYAGVLERRGNLYDFCMGLMRRYVLN